MIANPLKSLSDYSRFVAELLGQPKRPEFDGCRLVG